MESLAAESAQQRKRLEMLEKVPLETVKLLKTTIIAAIVSGAVGAILSAVMSAT